MEPVHITEVDGVPVVHTSCAGPTMGALMFRVGVCDETLTTRGITHLVEHLALSPFDSRLVPFNGSVGPTFTSFIARGTPAEVCAHLTGVARSLAGLPLDRAPHEARILQTEAAQRSPSLFGHASLLRYGPRGFGLLEYEEMFLHRPDPARIAHHAHEHCNRGNAVVVLSSPPTADLRLDALPAGVRKPVPVVEQLPNRHPSWDVANTRSVGMSTILPRGVAVPAATWILAEHLRAALRERHGLSYDAGSTFEPWSPTEAHHIVWADCRPQDATLVAEQLQTELARIMIEGVDPAELDAYRLQLTRSDMEPYAAYGWANHLATSLLLGSPLQTADEIAAEVSALTPADVETLIARIRSTAMWLVPNGVVLSDQRLQLLPQWSPEPLPGRAFATIDPRRGYTAHVSDTGVALDYGNGRWVSVPFARLAACKRWSDGGRSFFGTDAFSVHLEPGIWMASSDLVELVDRLTPPDRVVECAEPMVA